jgi:hypothetical protein
MFHSELLGEIITVGSADDHLSGWQVAALKSENSFRSGNQVSMESKNIATVRMVSYCTRAHRFTKRRSTLRILVMLANFHRKRVAFCITNQPLINCAIIRTSSSSKRNY